MGRSKPVNLFKSQNNIDLPEELELLRETTKSALLESWAEVETLQEDNAALEARNSALEHQVEELIAKEEELKELVQELQSKLQKQKPGALSRFLRNSIGHCSSSNNSNNLNKDPTTFMSNHDSCPKLDHTADDDISEVTEVTRKKPPHFDDSFSLQGTISTASDSDDYNSYLDDKSVGNRSWSSSMFWRNTASRIMDRSSYNINNNNSSRNEIESEFIQHLKEIEEDRRKEIAEWQVKVKGRDSAISSLERTAQLQSQTIQNMRSELERVRQKWHFREDEMVKKLHLAQKKVQERKKIIVEQADKLAEYQQYIKSLTTELEKLYQESSTSSLQTTEAATETTIS